MKKIDFTKPVDKSGRKFYSKKDSTWVTTVITVIFFIIIL